MGAVSFLLLLEHLPPGPSQGTRRIRGPTSFEGDGSLALTSASPTPPDQVEPPFPWWRPAPVREASLSDLPHPHPPTPQATTHT